MYQRPTVPSPSRPSTRTFHGPLLTPLTFHATSFPGLSRGSRVTGPMAYTKHMAYRMCRSYGQRVDVQEESSSTVAAGRREISGRHRQLAVADKPPSFRVRANPCPLLFFSWPFVTDPAPPSLFSRDDRNWICDMGGRLSAASSACSWGGATTTTSKVTRPLGGGTSRATPSAPTRGERTSSTWIRIVTRPTTSTSDSAVTTMPTTTATRELSLCCGRIIACLPSFSASVVCVPSVSVVLAGV